MEADLQEITGKALRDGSIRSGAKGVVKGTRPPYVPGFVKGVFEQGFDELTDFQTDPERIRLIKRKKELRTQIKNFEDETKKVRAKVPENAEKISALEKHIETTLIPELDARKKELSEAEQALKNCRDENE